MNGAPLELDDDLDVFSPGGDEDDRADEEREASSAADAGIDRAIAEERERRARGKPALPANAGLAAFCAAIEKVLATWPPCSTCGALIRPGGPCGVCADHADQRRIRIERALGYANVPPRYRWARRGSPLLAQRVQSAKALETAFAWDGADRIVLVGAAGSGKTSLATALLHEQIAANDSLCTATFVDTLELSSARRHMPLGEGEAPLVERAMRADIAVLDDLGSEPKDFAGAVASVVFERHKRELPTIFTTWASPVQLGSLYGAGVSRRIFDGALVITIGRGK